MQRVHRRTRALVTLLTTASVLVPRAESAPPMIEPNVVPVVDGTAYVIPDRRLALVPNVGILTGRNAVLVVDTGMGPANAEILLKAVSDLTELPVRYLVSTHFHPEHNFGAQAFPDATVVVYSEAQRVELVNKGEEYRRLFVELFKDDVRELLEPVRLIPPDVTFERTAQIDLGGLIVQLHFFGHAAHTRGDTVLYVPEHRILFSGGLTPNRFFPILADTDSSVAGWIATLEELEKFDVAIVVPDHGEVGDRTLIAATRRYLTELQTAARRLKTGGVALAEAQEALFAEYRLRYADWDDPDWIKNAVESVYAEDGP